MDSTRKLCKVIDTAIEEQDIDKLNLYFSSSTQDSSDVFNARTISTLSKILNKNEKHEDKAMVINCVLSCLQHFVDINIDAQKWDQQAENISKLCELVFTISSFFIEDEELIQRNTTVDMAIIECGSSIADNMLRYMLESVLKKSASSSISHITRTFLLSFIGTLLQKSSREIRAEIIPCVTDYLEKLSNILLICGDYEQQVSVMEVLARTYIFIKSDENKPVLFSDCPEILPIFNSYSFLNFDPECRLFLNQVNTGMGEKKLVYSIPCMVISANNVRLRKPNDVMYKEFWVDFNLGSRSVSFYYQQSETDGWDLMSIEDKNVLYAIAKNSSCKAKSGQIIPAVKIELNLKPDETKPYLPKGLKIYPRKTNQFAQLEQRVIKDILGEKYKSEVTYTDIPLPNRELQNNQSFKLIETSFEMSSCVEMTSKLQSKISDERDSENSDVVGASPPPLVKAPENRAIKEQTTKSLMCSMEESNQSGEYTRDSESFALHIKKLKNKENKENIIIENTLVEDEDMEIAEINNERKEELLESNSLKNVDIILSATENEIENINVNNPLINSPKKDTINSVDGKNGAISIDPKGQFSKKIKYSSHKHEPSNSSKKRRLYSREHNNTKDLILSSQEHFSAEIPAYKITKHQSPDNKNICHSYQSYKGNESSPVLKNNLVVKDDDIDVNINKLEHSFSDSEKPVETDLNVTFKKLLNGPTDQNKYFKNPVNCDKKLSNLNKTPESTKASGIFPIHTVYSDFSSSGRDICAKKTYARPKRRRGLKRIQVLSDMSSDSDSDYVPATKVSIHENEKRVTRNSDCGDGYVDRLHIDRVDPIRAIEVANEMELESLTIEEPNLVARKIEVDILPVNIRTEIPQKCSRARKGNIKVDNKKTPKNAINKGKKPTVQSRKLRGKKKAETVEETIENPAVFDLMHSKPFEANIQLEGDDLALEVLGHPISQDEVLPSTFKMNEMVQFGKCCVMQVHNKMEKIQSLAQKEREMNFAAFNFKTQSSFSSINTHCQKLQVVSNNLNKVKMLLDTTFTLQKDIATQIQFESAQLEEAKQDLINKVTSIEKSESSHIGVIFQGFIKYMKNLLFSFIQSNNTKKKALSK